jgi:hypothetical protein
MTLRIRAVLLAVGMAMVLLPPTATAEEAGASTVRTATPAPATTRGVDDPPDNFCRGLPKGVIVQLFEKRGHDRLVPLRCGHVTPQPNKPCNGFGFLHIKCKRGGSWPSGFSSDIQFTLLHPDVIRREDTSRTYISRAAEFKVVWQLAEWCENCKYPIKGIITASVER